MKAAELSRLAQAGRERAEKLTPALARVVRQILDDTVREAVQTLEEVAPHSLAAAAPTDLSAMVAVYPLPDEQAALARPGGEPAEELHVTLAFLGEVDDETLARVVRAMRQVALDHVPREGWVGGVGWFGVEPGPDAVYPALALPDVPGLPELRHAVVKALDDEDIEFAQNHGWLPHLTLAYTPEPSLPDPEIIGLPLTFRFLTVARGDVPVHLGLTGFPAETEEPVVAAAPPPDWRRPSSSDLVDVDALAATLRARTEHTRSALIESVMTAHLRPVGIAFDEANPLVAKALGSTGKHIVGVAQATKERVARAVDAAWTEGLSIENAATVIRSQMLEANVARSVTIARTELVTAANVASLSATQIVSDVTEIQYMKVWLTAPGAEHPRHEEYDDLDEQTVPLDGWFNVGGYDLEYPGDQGGPPEETVNCRCTLEYTEVAAP